MGNKCTATPTFTSDIIIEEDEPPDPPDVEGIVVALLETNFSLTQLEAKNGGKLQTLLKVSSSFNSQVSYTKPIHKVKSKAGLVEWHLHKRKYFFPTATPIGEIKVALVNSCLPHLPAVPCDDNGTPSLEKKKAVTLASLVIPVVGDEFKTACKHVERWINIETLDGEQGQVKVAIDYVFKSSFNINDKYEINDVLGSGQSVVKKGTNKLTKKEYAVKFIAKQTLHGQTIPRSCTDKEIELMNAVSHKNIVDLYESLESNDTRYIVMELVKGSDLFDISSVLGAIRPGVAGAIIGQLISAVAYLHSLGIVHNDIKMENVVVDYHENMVKLTDFGSAKDIKHMSGVGGTINYMAPELLLNMRGSNQKCDQSVDIWSVGIVAYMLLSGFHPFDQSTKANQNIINRIIAGKFEFPSPQWDTVPKHCKDFIQKCLVVDPKRRPSASDLLKHSWITSSSCTTPVNMLSKQEIERLDQEKTSKNNSRSNSMNSLLELFGNCPLRS